MLLCGLSEKPNEQFINHQTFSKYFRVHGEASDKISKPWLVLFLSHEALFLMYICIYS